MSPPKIEISKRKWTESNRQNSDEIWRKIERFVWWRCCERERGRGREKPPAFSCLRTCSILQVLDPGKINEIVEWNFQSGGGLRYLGDSAFTGLRGPLEILELGVVVGKGENYFCPAEAIVSVRPLHEKIWGRT